jgi:putative chitinase
MPAWKKNLNIETFKQQYRDMFKEKLDNPAGLQKLLTSIQNDPHITDPRQAAYMLATVKKEARHWMPIHEDKSLYTQHEYGKTKTVINPETGEKFQNKYYGRGYVQITHQKNYKTVGDAVGESRLVYKPDLALDQTVAYKIMSQGMREGLFTGVKLDQFINNKKTDYENARTIINGHDAAKLIANWATNFEQILKASPQ